MTHRRRILYRMICAIISCMIGLTLLIHAQGTNETIIYPDSSRQIIRGFGAANILPWRPDMTADQITKAFGTDAGQLGFSILRLRVPNQAGEFGINIPTAQMASSMGVTLIASPWSPPASMKTNNNIVGGMLNDSSYGAFAEHLQSFADYMAINDAPLYAISVQNEPDANVGYESCDWNATQMLNFMKNNAASVGIPVMMPESQNFQHSLSDSTLNDPAAAANVGMIAGHLYGGGLGPYPLATNQGKELWMTEYLSLDTSYAGVLATGKQINDVMNVGMSAYVWWYIVRYYGPINEAGTITKRGYIMSQYSRFIRPGFVRVDALTGPRSLVSVTAYKSDSRLIIVAVNMSPAAATQKFTIQNPAYGDVMFLSYVTSQSRNCEQGSDYGASNGSFSATLDGSSVTTFVATLTPSGVGTLPSVPRTATLSQNYPNPFNPTTQIGYTVPVTEHVSLKVYTVLGTEVATLFDGIRQPGRYEATYDAAGLPSGVYFYRLQAGSFTETKKLIVLR